MADYLSKFSGEEIDSLLDKIKDFNVINEIPSKSITDDKIADLSITTSLLSNGSVTTPKLGNDVTELITEIKNKGIINESRSKQNAIDIKTNQNFSLFNSDRLNILEAQINADKNTVEYTSDKSLEITCNGTNIIDCNAHFKKVEGQTRRYSLNLLSENKLVTSNCTYSDGVYTFTNVANLELFRDSTIKGDITIGLILLKKPVKSTSFTFYNGTINDNNLGFDNIQGYELNKTYTVNFNIDKSFLTMVWGNENNEEVKFKMWIVKGSYTAETIPPFQPYDNTLVNSKANFVSTGRNLFNGGYVTKKPNGMTYTLKGTRLEVSGTPTALAFDFLMNVTLPKGTYYVEKANMQGTITGSNYIQINKGTQWFTNEGKFTINETTTLSICYTIGADNKGKPINASFDIMISYGSSTKPYEPYIKNISQYDTELGAYDYIENGNLVKQTSEMVTLNGSENWTNIASQSQTNDKLFSFIIGDIGAIDRSGASNSTLPMADVWSVGSGEGYYCYNKNIFIRKNVTSLEKFKAWLKANPITLVYQKATPTITPIVVPNGIVSYKNGLTSQEIKGKYLPYKYTAKYVNGGQQ